ncbi:MAG: CHAT domain-containing protein, partial [Pseudomonadota bacterium]|nr:CHAT domain-containing protein [Pseudomonadota bacterium]
AMRGRFFNSLLLCCWNLMTACVIAQPQQAHHAFQQGHYQQAIEHWQSFLNTQPQKEHLPVRLGLAIAYRQLGFYEQALSHLQTGLSIAQHQPIYQVLLLNELSQAYFAQGIRFHQQAKQFAQMALREVQALNHPGALAYVLAHWGKLHMHEAYYQKALKTYEAALNHIATFLSQPAEDKFLFSKATILQLQAQVHIEQAQATFFWEDEQAYRYDKPQQAYQQSLTAFHQALATVTGLAWLNSYQHILSLIHLSQLALAIQQPLSSEHLMLLAYQCLIQAKHQAQQHHKDALLSQINGYLGQLYEQQQRYQEALKLTRKAIFLAQQTTQTRLLYLWQWQLGRLFKALKQPQAAIEAYRRAVMHLTPIRYHVANQDDYQLDNPLRSRIAPVYFQFADLLLQQASTTEDITTQKAYLREARQAIESFKAAELQDYFKNDCWPSTQECTDVEQLIEPQTAVLYPISLPERLELLLSFADEFIHKTVAIQASTLQEEVAFFLSLLRKHPHPLNLDINRGQHTLVTACAPSARGTLPLTQHYSIDLQPAQKLYQWLIAPLSQQLQARDIETLIIVPEGILQTIPFAALHDGKNFLIHDYALAVTPGLCLNTPRNTAQQQPLILLSGLSKATQGFSALPCVDYELKTLENLYNPQYPPVLNEQFTFNALKNTISQHEYSIIHIASHAQFNANLEESFLLTYDTKLTLDKVEQLMHLSASQTEPVELLTLSACETALGNDRAALGLAGIALKAGVQTALASLWQVDDAATPAVIIEFYRQLHRQHQSKAKALQQAQKKILTEKQFMRYRHPYYWAAFLLIGHWL